MPSEQRKAFGDGYFKEHRVFIVVVGLIRIHNPESDERSPFLTLVQAFHCGEFHRLDFSNLNCGAVTCENGEQYAGNTHDTTYFYGLECKVNMLALEKIPSTYTQYEHAAEAPGGKHGVAEFVNCNRRKCNGPKISHYIAHLVRVEFHPYRVLHPGVGNEYPPSGEGRANDGKPGGCQMTSR